MIRPPLPRWLAVPAGLAAVFLAVPLVAMFGRVDWLHLPSLLASQAAVDALWLSLRTCAASTVLCLVLGLPLAMVLARALEAAVRVRRHVPLVRSLTTASPPTCRRTSRAA